MLQPEEKGVDQIVKNHRQNQGKSQPSNALQKNDRAKGAGDHPDPENRMLKGPGVGKSAIRIQGLGKNQGIHIAFQHPL